MKSNFLSIIGAYAALSLFFGAMPVPAREADPLRLCLPQLPDSIYITTAPDSIFTSAIPDSLFSFEIPDSLFAAQEPDSLGKLAEERLKAKVDSLRSALSEKKPGRDAVNPAELLADADSLRQAYEFQRAAEICREALDSSPDAELEPKIRGSLNLARNGLSMMKYCTHPKVVARKTVALEDFFLHYPLEDHSWRAQSGAEGVRDSIAPANYFPEGAGDRYFSARDGNGILNIYHGSVDEDGEMSEAELMGERITSWKDEIYPMVSSDGRYLYFASRGLYGMGGYDLYMSQWDRDLNDWGEPMNMGFPYSSPYDDFLFLNSDDGLYSIFASNRDCPQDSVSIYVLEYDAMPLRKSVSDVQELRRLAALTPPDEVLKEEKQNGNGIEIGSYSAVMTQVRGLRDSLYAFTRSLDEMRANLAKLPASEQGAYLNLIRAKEEALPGMQKELDEASAALKRIEQDFLSSGVMTEKESPEPEKNSFPFEKRTMGKPIAISLPDNSLIRGNDDGGADIPEGLYRSQESRISQESSLPDGLIYRIVLATAVDRMAPEAFKGLEPLFEKMSTSLKYNYSAGVFRSYAEALAKLNGVRLLGFTEAFVSASLDGKTLSIKEARELERREEVIGG